MDPNDKCSPEQAGALLGLLVHDLRNPVATIWANADFLAEEGVAEGEAGEALSDVRLALRELQRGLERITWISRWLEDAALAVGAEGDVGEALRAAADEVPELDVRVAAPAALVVPGAELVRRVVVTALENARDHGHGGEVHVAAERRGDEVVVEVVDTGRALAPDLAAAAFSVKGQPELKGAAGHRYGKFAGLLACRAAAEALGGAFEAGGRDGAASFQLRIPAL